MFPNWALGPETKRSELTVGLKLNVPNLLWARTNGSELTVGLKLTLDGLCVRKIRAKKRNALSQTNLHDGLSRLDGFQ